MSVLDEGTYSKPLAYSLIPLLSLGFLGPACWFGRRQVPAPRFHMAAVSHANSDFDG